MLILPLAPAPLAPSEDKFFAHFFHFHFPASNTVLKNISKSLNLFSSQKYPKNTWIITVKITQNFTYFWKYTCLARKFKFFLRRLLIGFLNTMLTIL